MRRPSKIKDILLTGYRSVNPPDAAGRPGLVQPQPLMRVPHDPIWNQLSKYTKGSTLTTDSSQPAAPKAGLPERLASFVTNRWRSIKEMGPYLKANWSSFLPAVAALLLIFASVLTLAKSSRDCIALASMKDQDGGILARVNPITCLDSKALAGVLGEIYAENKDDAKHESPTLLYVRRATEKLAAETRDRVGYRWPSSIQEARSARQKNATQVQQKLIDDANAERAEAQALEKFYQNSPTSDSEKGKTDPKEKVTTAANKTEAGPKKGNTVGNKNAAGPKKGNTAGNKNAAGPETGNPAADKPAADLIKELEIVKGKAEAEKK
jgi:hypothetical protein